MACGRLQGVVYFPRDRCPGAVKFDVEHLWVLVLGSKKCVNSFYKLSKVSKTNAERNGLAKCLVVPQSSKGPFTEFRKEAHMWARVPPYLNVPSLVGIYSSGQRFDEVCKMKNIS